MYFLRYQPLKEQLRTRSLSDKEALPYLVLLCGLAAAATLFSSSEAFNSWDWVSGGLSVVLAVCGVFYAYSKNGGRAGVDLIQKYIVIGWIASVRCTLVFIPIIIALYFGIDRFGVITEKTGVFDVLILTCFEVILYQRIGRHIGDTK